MFFSTVCQNWVVGSTVHLGLTLFVISRWMHGEPFKVEHINPSWFFLSIGLCFWVLLFARVFNRLLFQALLPAKLPPTLFILIAPPAVGFVSYIKLTGETDSFARILFYIGLFITSGIHDHRLLCLLRKNRPRGF